jgi:hypothetical protein
MRIATGKVVSGRVVLEDERLAEGARVTVSILDDDGGFDLTPEEEERLRESIREVERGRTIEGSEWLRNLGPDS